MTLNNAFKIYDALTSEYTPNRRAMTMPESVKELAHALMQRGDDVRLRKAHHPNPSRDLTNVFDYGTGNVTRSDAIGYVARNGKLPYISTWLSTL